MPMKRLGLAWLLWCGVSAQAAQWIYFHTAVGNSSEYYNPAMTRQGKSAILRTFSQFSMREMVPLEDPKGVFKFKLVPFASEQSAYALDCQSKSVQLISRTFYRDPGGKIQIITYQDKAPFIAKSNSEFAKQFLKTGVFPENVKAVKMMNLACQV
jgi:hypothetical protein